MDDSAEGGGCLASEVLTVIFCGRNFVVLCSEKLKFIC